MGMLISCRWLLSTFWIAAISSKSLEDDHYSQQQKEEKRPHSCFVENTFLSAICGNEQNS
jgi:hypothetical protein